MTYERNRKLLKIEYELDCGSLVKGHNKLELSLEKSFEYNFFQDITLEKAEIKVVYKK